MGNWGGGVQCSCIGGCTLCCVVQQLTYMFAVFYCMLHSPVATTYPGIRVV